MRLDTLTITGAQFRDMVFMGAALLEKNKALVDSLNVFPVPDGDTGTNMYMTMASAVQEIRSIPEDAPISRVADALSMGALRGARGNSGVILSQLFRGFSKACKGQETMDGQLLAKALDTGANAAYKAVMKPREGTILTVARACADKAMELAEREMNFYRILDEVIETGEIALAHTPELLAVLKEAGVVDSGGKGLMFIYHGFKLSLDGEEVDGYRETVVREQPAPVKKPKEELFGYSTEFMIVHPPEPFRAEDIQSFRDHLGRLGSDVQVEQDADRIRVHVHSDAPGKVLQLALRLGELDELNIENVRMRSRRELEERKRNEKEIALISVSVGDGLDELFHELGAAGIISGGQTMNPSIETIAGAVENVNARNVIILPNNSNIILAAQQAVELCESKVSVIPTKTIPQGIAAAMAFNPLMGMQENVTAMEAGIGEVVSGSVTYAVRDSRMEGTQVRKGDIIGLMDNHMAVSEESVEKAAISLVRCMVEKKGFDDGTVTLIYGKDVAEEDAEALLAKLQEEYPDAEIMLQPGGQPLYYYFISLE